MTGEYLEPAQLGISDSIPIAGISVLRNIHFEIAFIRHLSLEGLRTVYLQMVWC
jgi:hypothetical protein